MEGETPLEQKVSVAEYIGMRKTMAVDSEKVELMVDPWVEHVGEVLELLLKTVVSQNAGKVHQEEVRWMLEEEV